MAEIRTEDEKKILLKNEFGVGDALDKIPGEDLVTSYIPTRMHRKQKKVFRDILCDLSEAWGYEFNVESNIFAKNCVIGKPDKAKVIVGAHYDTPPRLPKFVSNNILVSSAVLIPSTVLAVGTAVPLVMLQLAQNGLEIPNLVSKIEFWQNLGAILPAAGVAYLEGMLGGANKKNFNDNSSGVLGVIALMHKYKDLPQEEKNKLAFVMFDNEEKGLFGSISYAVKHRKFVKKQHMVNLDCLNGKTVNLYTRGESASFVKSVQSGLTGTGIKLKKSKLKFLKMSDHFPFIRAKSATGVVNDVDNVHSSADNKLDRKNMPHIIDAIAGGVESLACIKKNKPKSKPSKKSAKHNSLLKEKSMVLQEVARLENLIKQLNLVQEKLVTDKEFSRGLSNDDINAKLKLIAEKLHYLHTRIDDNKGRYFELDNQINLQTVDLGSSL